MTIEDLKFAIEVKRPLDFVYNNKTYSLRYDKDKNGREIILFGLLYEEKKFQDYGEFFNHAQIENHFFREMLELF